MSDLLSTNEVRAAIIAAIAAMLSAVLAAAATIIGPFLTTRIARRQTTAALRQQWIDRLRDDLSEFLSLINHYLIYDEIPLETGDEQSLYRRLTFLESKLQMMVNPKEPDHQMLIGLIGKLIVLIHNDTLPSDKRTEAISEHHNNLIALSQRILKREWERVKKE